MRRREFIAGLGGAVAWPLAANAQGGRVRRIGALFLFPDDPALRSWNAAFERGLREQGWTIGADLLIADDLVRRQVAVNSNIFFSQERDQLILLAARQGIPTMFWDSTAVPAGALSSYGPDQLDAFRQAGVYAGRILSGEKPGDLPVIQPTKFELMFNLKTAKALRLEIPAPLLALADEVIE